MSEHFGHICNDRLLFLLRSEYASNFLCMNSTSSHLPAHIRHVKINIIDCRYSSLEQTVLSSGDRRQL